MVMRRWLIYGVAVLLVVLAAVVYFTFDPSQAGFFPRCTFLTLTGYKCPGCGTQRMIYHLLHGHVLKAISYNYFASLLIPYLLVLSTGYLAPDSNYTQWVRKHLATKWAAYTYATLYIIWWFLRNILDL